MMWRDKSSRHDDGRIWELKLPNLKVCVHRHIYYDKNTWLLTCGELDIIGRVLTSNALREAQVEGLKLVQAKINKYRLDIDKELGKI